MSGIDYWKNEWWKVTDASQATDTKPLLAPIYKENMYTSFYDVNTGEHLKDIQNGIDEAVAIEGRFADLLNEKTTYTEIKQLGGITLGGNTVFEMIAATLYAEAGYKTPNSTESAAIYDVIENRSKVRNNTIMEIIKRGDIYGYGSRDYKIALAKGKGYEKKDYNVLRHNSARIGAILGITTSTDYSQGSYFWEATIYIDNPTKYPNNYFNKEGHGTTVGTRSKQITFFYTTRIGETQFMKYNPDIYPNKTWP